MNVADPKPIGAPPQHSSLALSDIYYVLFRRKWLILFCMLAGVMGSGLTYYLTPPVYESDARLLVRYVLETKPMESVPTAAAGDVKSADLRGETLISSELDIITSLDLAQQVAATIGPERILASYGGGTNLFKAAGLIRTGLNAEVPRKSSVIWVTFSHRDPGVVQLVLQKLIETYYDKHVEIHRPLATFETFLERKSDESRTQLQRTEQQLKELKARAGVVSVEEARQTLNQQEKTLRQNLMESHQSLAQEEATWKALEKLDPNLLSGSGTNSPAIPRAKLADYRNICQRFDAYRKRETELLVPYTELHPQVRAIREQIAEAEKQKTALENEYPQLVEMGTGLTGGSTTEPRANQIDPVTQRLRIVGLQAKVKKLMEQLDEVRGQETNIDNVATAILQLQRQRDLEETNYRYFLTSLEQARTDQTLGAAKTSNIGRVQEPSPPLRAADKVRKRALAILAAGLLGGIALAFFLELVVNQTIRRPKEVEQHLRLPLFISIPRFSPRAMRVLNGEPRKRLAAPEGEQTTATVPPEPPTIPPTLQPYMAALRDRLSVHLEKFKHKPKLVAVTGLSNQAGTSTVAAGLAAMLSENGDGKVLLVDMNLEQGAAHPYLNGRPALALTDLTEQPSAAGENPNQTLDVARGQTGNRKSLLLPSRFASLVPKLVATDYDYIIFDMPPITATSVTPRLARMMDTTLLVVESERTQRDVLKEAGALLQAHKADVAVVLNKKRNYVPRRLLQEI